MLIDFVNLYDCSYDFAHVSTRKGGNLCDSGKINKQLNFSVK